ncbi:hypothetical protein HX773_02780 [Pantoea sp. B9002]|uniref:Ig-like domain-containing protein n=1 Tax=Pantoea sp. B9002 TaxID=2726979 RepID=UPI0015A23733|nr:Ig-like domain-containing protein [Pantoea sp. B9002]NWA59814.1 hypothetical protein [Pantoea sp. B9002]
MKSTTNTKINRNSFSSINPQVENGVLSTLVTAQTVSKPVISDVYDNFGPVQRLLAHGETTDDRNPKIGGTALSDTQYIHLYRNGVEVAKVAVIDGQWSWEGGANVFGTGYNNIVVRGENSQGQLSDASEPFLIIVAGKPGVPVIFDAIDDAGGLPEIIKRGGKTDDDTPTLRGSGVPGSIITLQTKAPGGKWVELGSATVDSEGKWQLTSSQLSENGDWSFRAKAANGHGASAWSDSFTLQIEGLATAQPVLTEVLDNFGQIKKALANNSNTDDHNPRFSGTADSSIKFVHIYDGNTKIATVLTNKGKWSWESDANIFGSGKHQITLRGEDAGGAISEPTAAFDFTITAAAPGVPVIINALDDISSVVEIIDHKGKTSDSTPTLNGLGAEGSVVTIQALSPNGEWEIIGSTVVGSNERWSFTTTELTQTGNWGFRVMSSNENGKSGWSSKFVLKLVEVQPEIEEITSVNTDITTSDILAKSTELLFNNEPNSYDKFDSAAIADLENYSSNMLSQYGVVVSVMPQSSQDLNLLPQDLLAQY